MYERLKKFTVVILLFLLVIFFAVQAEGFASMNNLFNLLRQVAILGIVSTGMTLIIVTGGIDLSVGGVISFVSCAVALMISKAGMNPLIACIIGVMIAVAALVLNSLIIQYTGMPAILCTLAAMQIYGGLTYIIIHGMPVNGLPGSMRMIGQGYIGPIPIPVIIMLAIFAAGEILLKRTYLGRYFYAIGSNSESARLSGVSIKKVNITAFAICGLFVGLAAIIQMSRLFGGYANAGSGLEMEAVTAVVVGGVSFSGGSGSIRGVVLGVLLMGILSNGLSIMGVNSYMQAVFKGLVLILVVGLDYYQKTRHSSKKKKAEKMDADAVIPA